MNFKISSWAIRNPIPIIVLFLLLTVLGIRAFQGLPINADPDMRFPMVNITVTQTGASADELENTVTRRVEDAVAGMAGVRHITSTITEGSSVTAVEFRLETDTDRAVNDVRNAITQIRGNLPQNIDNPVVERMDTEGGALGYYAVQSPNMNQTELSWFIDDAVSRELLAVNGVQQVKRLGGEKREVRVALLSAKLNALGITAEQVSQQLAQTNANVPAGRVQWFDQEQSIRVVGSQPSLVDLANLPIALSDYRKVKLAELATIRDSHADVRSRTRLNGREVLGFQVFRSKGSSDTAVEKGVQQALKRLVANYPDIQMTEVHNSVNITKENYNVAISTLLEGTALTVLVVLVLLFKDFLQPLTILTALSLSIGGAAVGLLAYGAALDMSSVIGILMLMGIVTKNSILLVDFVIEKRQQGMARHQALIQSGSERVRPILMTTIAMVAGMVPAVFASGAGAAFRAPMAIAVICGLTASTLLSLVFVPVVYSLMDDLREYLAPKLAKLTSVTGEDRARK